MKPLAAGVAFAITSAILLGLPSVDGSAIAATTTFTAPYLSSSDRGTALSLPQKTGCSNFTAQAAPHWFPKSGRAGFQINATSPACSNRVGRGFASWANVFGDLLAGTKFAVPTTGFHSMSVNLTVSWRVSWNITVPNCTNLGTNTYFKCTVEINGDLTGGGYLAHTYGRAVTRSTHPTWTSSMNGLYGRYQYLCSTPSNNSCKSSSTARNGVRAGTGTYVWNITGYLNSSSRYVVGFIFDFAIETESDHTRGGVMTGGTAAMSESLAIRINSISIT